MKIRQGFVSNSSSSSFCIIGVNDDKWVKELLKAEKIDYEHNHSHGMSSGRVVDFYGYYHEPIYAGAPAIPLLARYNLRDAEKEFQRIVKEKLNLEIPIGAIDLFYGEIGDG